MRENSKLRNWKLINFCELDKYAAKSYCAIHNVDENLNLGDITKVDETKLQNFNMICGGSPCQDFSVAGEQKGSIWTCKDCSDENGKQYQYNPLIVHWSKREKCPHCGGENIEKTRSSLLVEYLRVIRGNKPHFGMYENVKNIVGKKFKDTTFKLFEDELHEYGYNTYWQVLNAKDYGVPQNRERVYLIFIRKDLDNGKFSFPKGFDNGIRLKDVLEDEVDEKYYISDDKVQRFLENLYYDESRETVQSGGGQSHIMCGIDKSVNDTKQIEYANCITAREDRGISNRKSEGTAILEIPVVSEIRRNENNNVIKVGKTVTKNNKSHQKDDVIHPNGVSSTLLSSDYKQPKQIYLNQGGIKIRKLTPKECFRLMGFSDEDFFRAMIGSSKLAEEFIGDHEYLIGKTIMDEAETIQGISNSQLYKMAGNSIVVDVLYYILVGLYDAMPYLFEDLKLSSFFSGIGAFEASLNRLYKSINSGNFTKPQAE